MNFSDKLPLPTNMSKQQKVCCTVIGKERIPVISIDDIHPDPDLLAIQGAHLDQYTAQQTDNYPGQHAKSLPEYEAFLCNIIKSYIAKSMGINEATNFHITSRYSRVTTPESELSALQSIPHFDSLNPTQIAVVHYLCPDIHGGTGFYRHCETGFEQIYQNRLPQYQRSIKRSILHGRITGGIYLCGSGQGFELSHAVNAAWNRAIFYPSNLLHCGQINAKTDVAKSDHIGRLTLTSQITFNT